MVFPKYLAAMWKRRWSIDVLREDQPRLRMQEHLCPAILNTAIYWTQLPDLSFHEFSLQPVLEVPSETEDESQNNMTKTARNAEKARRS
jgi:hypothetical protein